MDRRVPFHNVTSATTSQLKLSSAQSSWSAGTKKFMSGILIHQNSVLNSFLILFLIQAERFERNDDESVRMVVISKVC